MAFFPNWIHDTGLILRGAGNPLAAGKVDGITAFGCGRKVITDAFASLRCDVLTRNNQVVPHWVSDCFNFRPNEYQTPQALKKAIGNSCIDYGEAFVELDTAKHELHFIPAYAVSVDETDYRNFKYKVSTSDGQQRELSKDQILHIITSPDSTGRRGIGVLAKYRNALEAAAQQQVYDTSIWKNLIRPFVAIKAAYKMKKEAKDNWLTYFKKIYSGAENAGGGLILDEGVDAEFINISPADTQFLEQRRFTVEEVARMFPIPTPYLCDLRGATWANLSELSIIFANQSVKPIAQPLEEECELKCFSSAEPFQLKFNLHDLVKGSLASTATAISQIKAAGVASTNEIREFFLDWKRTDNPEDDKIVQPLNMTTGDVGGNPKPNN